MTIRGLLWTGRLVAGVAVIAMLLTLVLGLRLVSVEGQRGDSVITLQAEIDYLSSLADDLALNGATETDLAAFVARTQDVRHAILRLDGEPAVQNAAAEQVHELEHLLRDMTGPDGQISASPDINPIYRAHLDALAGAGRVLDGAILDLLQTQKSMIIQRIWVVAIALAGLGLSLLAVIAILLAWLDRSIVAPIGRLTAVVDRIGAGDLTARAPATGGNELATLGRHINAMADGRAESEAGLRAALSREAELNAALSRTQKIGQLGGWHADLVGDVLTWDRQSCLIHGIDAPDARGDMDLYFSRIDPRDRDWVMALRHTQIGGGDQIDFQHRIVTPEGVKWVWQQAVVVRGADGEAVALDGTVQDISQLKEIELELQTARETAERGEALLRIAGRTARIGGWRFEIGSERIEWSAETAAIYDEPLDTAPSVEDAFSYFDADDRCRLSQVFRDCVENGREFNDVFRPRTAQGRRIWVRITGEAVRGADDQIVELRGACQDITDLMNARSEADRRNADLVGVVSSLEDGFVMLDEGGKVSFFNERARALFGLETDFREGMDLTETLALASDKSVQGGLGAILRSDRKPRRTVLPDQDKKSWVEIAIQEIEERSVIIARDVTAARQAQRRLLLLDAALEEIDNIVLIIEVDRDDPEADMNVVYANSALQRVTGIAVDEIIDLPPRDRYPQETEAQREQLDRLDAAMRAREPASAELFTYKEDGSQIWLNVQLFPLDDPNSDRSYVVAIERDVTHQKESEERAFHSAKLEAVGQLTGGVAHDFNNLLTVILGNADMLYDTVAGDDKRRRVGALIEAAERGARLTDSMLAFSRRTPLRPARTDINQLMEQSQDLLRQAVPENIEIDMALDAERPVAEIDASRLQAAIMNLVLNSRDAIDGHGHITLATTNIVLTPEDAEDHPDAAAGPFILITVSDDGTGILPMVLPQVFEPFFTTKPPGSGTGLGLSTVYGFAKQSGGHVRIYSEPGLGTAVRLYLPCANGAAVKQAVDRMAKGLPQGRDEHVLVVEDDPALLDYVVSQLHRLRYRVTAVGDAEAALDVLAQDDDTISLLFTDVILPGELHGGLLAEKALEMRPDLKILFTSGYTRSALDRQGRIDPTVKLLGKPYRLADLSRSLREALDA